MVPGAEGLLKGTEGSVLGPVSLLGLENGSLSFKKKGGEKKVIVQTAGIIFVQTKAPPKLNRDKYGSK